MSGRAADGPPATGAAIRLTLDTGMATGDVGVTSTPEGGTPGATADPYPKSDQMVVALVERLQGELAEARAQAATLRAWMAEYPNDKYTGTWWLAEFDRITGKAGA